MGPIITTQLIPDNICPWSKNQQKTFPHGLVLLFIEYSRPRRGEAVLKLAATTDAITACEQRNRLRESGEQWHTGDEELQ